MNAFKKNNEENLVEEAATDNAAKEAAVKRNMAKEKAERRANARAERAKREEADVIDVNDPVGMGDWFFSIFLAAVPILNLICLLVWSFGRNTKPSKRSWARAKLIWVVLGYILFLLMFVFYLGMISRM